MLGFLRRLAPLLLSLALLPAKTAVALPIGFGINQGELVYDELNSKNFHVYFDHRAPHEGAMTLNALEAARPYAERWIGQHRQSPLTVVTSAASENASFANFLTDAIELQTLGQGYKELAWHEYTHSTMYRTFDNLFGPAGNILYLPWMPAWFIEGLAEAFSVSSGSDVTAGIERYQALSGNWPTYDRLHSLYSTANFVERGYATGGAMVTYLLKRLGPEKLPLLLQTFYRYAQPWWWPTTVVPYVEMMPLDRALKDMIGMSGEEFYEAYKEAATAHWKKPQPFVLPLMAEKTKEERYRFNSLYGFSSDGVKMRLLARDPYDFYEWETQFNAKTGWATEFKRGALVTTEPQVSGVLSGQHWRGFASYRQEPPQDKSTLVFTPVGQEDEARRLTRPGAVYQLWEAPKTLLWFEQQQQTTRLCATTKAAGKSPVHCPLVVTQPQQLRPLGGKPLAPGDRQIRELWFSQAVQKLEATTYSVSVYDALTDKVTRRFSTGLGQPLGVAFAGDNTWVLLGERNERSVRHYDRSGHCVGMLRFQDHILDIKGLANGTLTVAVYSVTGSEIVQLHLGSTEVRPCTVPSGQMSPLQFAIDSSHGNELPLAAALHGATLWQRPTDSAVQSQLQAAAKAPTIDRDVQANTGSETTPHAAEWRAKPLFIFPWIGGDDAKGLQFGAVSVPLVDHLQNETVRATFLYGPASHFPYQELALTSTRFTPTLNLAVYRQQTYEGLSYKLSTKEDVVNYLDEKGARFESLVRTRMLGGTASFGLALKYAYLKPYIGNPNLRRGFLLEPGASLGLAHQVKALGFYNSISARVAPPSVNRNFDYNQIGAATTVALALPAFARFSLGLEGSRTRGGKRRRLQELYRPLKTFIPGSGGGLNQNSFPLTEAVTGGLFAAQFGDSQARAKADFTMPLIRDLDKQWWLLYFQRLDFTAFFNYGAGWNGPKPAQGWNRLTRAHGYNLDLQMENKGVHFNAGGGIGQVIGRAFEPYVDAGFDALF